MAHKTLVGGTAYENKGGRGLVDGTVYSILKGRALVDGTGYDVAFGPESVLVMIVTDGHAYASVEINGVEYQKNPAAVEVNAGDALTFNISSQSEWALGVVYVDGTRYLSKSDGSASKSWTVPDGCRYIKIELERGLYTNEDTDENDSCGEITVTTSNAIDTCAAITGSGSATYCYVNINGKKYSSSQKEIAVNAGDVITFSVYGKSATYYGEVTIDGEQVLEVTNSTTSTYSWTVPSGIAMIIISMTYKSTSSQRNGRITVTTT